MTCAIMGNMQGAEGERKKEFITPAPHPEKRQSRLPMMAHYHKNLTRAKSVRTMPREKR